MKTMKLPVPFVLLSAFCFLCPAVEAAMYSQTYYGNAQGTEEVVGNGTLNMSGTVGGSIYFSFLNGGGNYATPNNLVFYLDTIPNAGFHDTSSFMDYNNGRTASISGFNGSRRTVATFANGFYADYAIVLNGDGAYLYQLGQAEHTYMYQLANFAGITTRFDFSAARADLGLARDGALNFQTAYMNNVTGLNAAQRTPQTFEGLNWSGTWNGWNDVSYSYFNVFPVPETTTIALTLFAGLIVLSGLGVRLRRYWTTSKP